MENSQKIKNDNQIKEPFIKNNSERDAMEQSVANMNVSLNQSKTHVPLELYKTISQESTGWKTIGQTLKMIFISLPNVSNYFSLWILFFAFLKASEMMGVENKLTAYALTFMWANALGYALIVSLNIGFMAMSAQAIGAGKPYLVSYYYQRTQVISFILIALLSIVMCFTGKIFGTFADEEVAEYSQQFIIPYLPSLFFYILFDSTRNLFNAHTQFKIPNILVLITYSVHFFWCWLLIKPLNLDMYGLGLSRSITEFFNCIILFGIIKYKNLFPNIKLLWGKQAFRGWLNLLKYTLPMGSIIYMDWIASEMQTIFVAAMHDEDAASGHSAFVTIQVLYVVFFLGLGVTVEPFVGQAMGQRDLKSCKQIRKQTLIGSLFLSIMVSIITFCVEGVTAKAFTNTVGEEINFIKCYRVMNYLIVHFYSLSMTMGSILRATGQQNSAFFLPLFYYFVLGIPLQYLFVFTFEWGLYGSWFAYLITIALTSLSYCYIVFKTNFYKQADVVFNNMQKQLKLILEDAKVEQPVPESQMQQQELSKQNNQE